MQKTNFHTHTARCGHASGEDEQYVRSAIRGGYRVLGFSDHTPWSYASDFVSPIRMPLDALPDYVRSVRSLQRRYAGRIELRLGLECEYFEDYMPWLRDTIREYRLDYVIFGNHFYRTDERYPYFGSDTRSAEMLDLYAESAIRGMETGLYARIGREICRRASRLRMPLEYNVSMIAYNEAHGVAGVPHPDFWRIAADEGCTAIVGIDAHDHRVLESGLYYDRAVRELAALGIPVIDTIPFFEY